MNRPTKLLFVALGVAASLGLWGKFSSKPLVVHRPMPTPAAKNKKPQSSWYRREVCKKCGEEYQVPIACTFVPTEEETKHYHMTPEEEKQTTEICERLLKGQGADGGVDKQLRLATDAWERRISKEKR